MVKRIVNGTAYNTDLSVLLLRMDDRAEWLYQGRTGEFFTCTVDDKLVPVPDDEAKDLLYQNNRRLHNIIWKSDIALHKGDGRNILGLRIPPALQAIVENEAAKAGLNINRFVLELLEEKCVVEPDSQ